MAESPQLSDAKSSRRQSCCDSSWREIHLKIARALGLNLHAWMRDKSLAQKRRVVMEPTARRPEPSKAAPRSSQGEGQGEVTKEPKTNHRKVTRKWEWRSLLGQTEIPGHTCHFYEVWIYLVGSAKPRTTYKTPGLCYSWGKWQMQTQNRSPRTLFILFTQNSFRESKTLKTIRHLKLQNVQETILQRQPKETKWLRSSTTKDLR